MLTSYEGRFWRYKTAHILLYTYLFGVRFYVLPKSIMYPDTSQLMTRITAVTEIRPHLYSNIVLTGGNCLLPGFRERL